MSEFEAILEATELLPPIIHIIQEYMLHPYFDTLDWWWLTNGTRFLCTASLSPRSYWRRSEDHRYNMFGTYYGPEARRTKSRDP